jgi:hypothetical protein
MKALTAVVLTSVVGFVSAFSVSQQGNEQNQRHFSATYHHTRQCPRSWLPSATATSLGMASNGDDNQNGLFTPGKLPIRTLVLSLIGVFSVSNLQSEIPQILSGSPGVDYIGTALDAFFVCYAVQNILTQVGVVKSDNSASAPSLDGFECSLTVNVGREQGTWMEKDWAVSGARLVFPINVRFSDEEVDLGIPGEEGLGGRYCKKLVVLDEFSRFVGSNGEETVRVADGGWATSPVSDRNAVNGENKLRFFLDFPDGASRNDVSVPAGRVYFSGVAFEDTAVVPSDLLSASSASIVEGPGSSGVVNDGGLSIKKNGWANLYGALGDVNLILGRYKISPTKKLNE